MAWIWSGKAEKLMTLISCGGWWSKVTFMSNPIFFICYVRLSWVVVKLGFWQLCSNLLQSYAKLSARLDKVMVSFALISVLGNLLLFDTTNMTIYDFYNFLFRFCPPSKTEYVWRMLVIYFKNGSAIIREQELHFQVISAKCDNW